MKAFWFAIIALVLMCIMVGLSSIFVGSVSKDMYNEAMKIKSSSSIEEFNRLGQLWDKNKCLISLSIPHKETDKFEQSLVLLSAQFETKDENGVHETTSLLLRAIEEIEAHGTISFDNIF